MAVWCSIVVTKSDRIKSVIVSAKVKWSIVMGWDNEIIQADKNQSRFWFLNDNVENLVWLNQSICSEFDF